MSMLFKSFLNRFDQPDILQSGHAIHRITHLFFWTACLGLIAFIVWCSYSKLDIVSIAAGKVMPSSRVKSIQHLEGGIISNIVVKEGDRVTVNQPLVYLEKIWQGASSDELQAKTVALQMDIIRVQAELSGKSKVVFPLELEKQQPLLANRVKALMIARLHAFQSELAAQKEKIIQRQKYIDEIKARNKNDLTTLKLVNKQLAISKGLLKDKLTTEYNHLSLLKEASQKKGDIEQGKALFQGAQSALKEARTVLGEIENRFIESGQRELKDTGQMLEELSKRQLKMDDSLARTIVRAPVAGIVKTLHIVTRGGIVQPGMKILDIVPEDDQLIIQAKLPVADVGYVRNGQRAVLNLASNDARRFGSIEGEVSHISPDTFGSQDGNVYYTVHILPKNNVFEKGSARYDLYPGVLINVFIHTGQRTIMDYILEPFLTAVDTAMQER